MTLKCKHLFPSPLHHLTVLLPIVCYLYLSPFLSNTVTHTHILTVTHTHSQSLLSPNSFFKVIGFISIYRFSAPPNLFFLSLLRFSTPPSLFFLVPPPLPTLSPFPFLSVSIPLQIILPPFRFLPLFLPPLSFRFILPPTQLLVNIVTHYVNQDETISDIIIFPQKFTNITKTCSSYRNITLSGSLLYSYNDK